MKAVYGPVVEIKALASRGVTRVSIEIPEEFHKEVTALFWAEHVLITMAPKEMRATHPFGIVGDDDPATAPAPEAAPQEAPPPDDERKYGALATELKLSGFFRAPKVYEAIGTDEDYQDWCRKQVCGLTKRRGEAGDPIVYAHVRRARNSGTSYRPKYHGLPLLNSAHQMQHSKGEAATILAYSGKEMSVEDAKFWFDMRVLDHLERWGWETLKAELGYESWAQVPPIALRDWAEQNNVTHILPRGYRDE